MRIGIISDTHINNHIERLKVIADKYLSELDLIIHAGDYISYEVARLLNGYGDFVGVWGNVDDEEIKGKLKQKEIIKVLGYNIGVFHGHGQGKTTLERAYDEFKEDDVDIIVFGHSHQPIIKTKNKILMLNPGSITSKRKERWHSFIILEIDDNGVYAQLRFIE